MFKKIITYFCLIFFFYNNLHAEIINKITVNGNKRVNSDTIILFSGLKINDDISELNLNESIKRLYDTDFFKNISVKFEKSHLIFTVSENLIIQNLTITGIKRKPTQKLLLAEVSLKNSSPFIESKVKDDINKIKSILQRVGYYFSSVEPIVKKNQNVQFRSFSVFCIKVGMF